MPEAGGRAAAAAVREADAGDAGSIWRIFAAVVAAGDTYAYPPETPREEAVRLWTGGGARCYVACAAGGESDDEVVGTYTLRANQPGLGAHVANAAFMVDPSARGRGIGRLLGEHALATAAAAGFRAMQFNLVVAENEAAIRLWRSLGFEVAGRLPGAFHWRRERYVDALVMFRALPAPPEPLLPFQARAGGSCSRRSRSSMNESSLDLDARDGPRDECGVFGIYAPDHDVSRLAYFALFALQHRGQESAGIAAADHGGQIVTRRELGLVSQVFHENDLATLAGELAIGHVRYSTTGGNHWENSQPVQRSAGSDANRREIALAHNGNLINAVELHAELIDRGASFRSTSDSEIIAALIATHAAERIEDAVADVLPRLKGAFSTVVMTNDRVIAFRDPHGLRPLVLGELPPGGPGEPARYCVASESCAFDIIGARLLRDVRPGEIISIGAGGLRSIQVTTGEREAFCVFEYIYFARPDSRMGGNVLQVVRGRMGEILAREAPVEADLVIPVPDSGNPAARGYARASGLPQDDGFVKNRYVARTFIQPGQELRKHGLRMKFNPLPEVVAGKRIVVVDDSIVRGNTTKQIVKMLRDAGAAEIHMRICAPPIEHPCHYGIDMSTREEMIAHRRTVPEIAAELDCDSLAYLSLAGVYEAIKGSRDTHCDACFTGEYPLEGHHDTGGKFSLELPLAPV